MSSYPKNIKKVSHLIVDNDEVVILLCGFCQRKLSSYREVRYHFSIVHEVSKEQYARVSKLGRLLKK